LQLHTNGKSSIVAYVFVAARMCLTTRCLAMDYSVTILKGWIVNSFCSLNETLTTSETCPVVISSSRLLPPLPNKKVLIEIWTGELSRYSLDLNTASQNSIFSLLLSKFKMDHITLRVSAAHRAFSALNTNSIYYVHFHMVPLEEISFICVKKAAANLCVYSAEHHFSTFAWYIKVLIFETSWTIRYFQNLQGTAPERLRECKQNYIDASFQAPFNASCT
jgi:hypothetical protein